MRVLIAFCAAGLLGLLPCVLAAAPPVAERPQVGRYQMAVSDRGIIYVLDTATGQCWSRGPNGHWIDAGNPTEPQKVAADAKSPPTLRLPQAVVSLTLKQRSAKAVPGSEERVFLRVDDITGGQVLISLRDDEGETVLDDVSVEPGEVIDFKVGEKSYFVRVRELQNFLVGSDIALLEIASDPKAFQPMEPPEAETPRAKPLKKKPVDR